MRLILASILILAACDSPSLSVSKSPVTRMTVGGMDFSVRRDGDYVEAIRTSKHWRPRLSHVLANASQAMETATGCPVRKGSLKGDAAIIKARLACGGMPNLPAPAVPKVEIGECIATDRWVNRGLGIETTQAECPVSATYE